ANEPACGASGTASFTLPPGIYNWKANCGSQDSTSGVLTVQSSQCVKQEVLFAPPTNCHVSDIAFYEATTNLPIYSIRSIYDANNRVTNVRAIDSTTGTIDN